MPFRPRMLACHGTDLGDHGLVYPSLRIRLGFWVRASAPCLNPGGSEKCNPCNFACGFKIVIFLPITSFETQRNGLVFIYDMADSHYSNFELDLSKKILNLLKVMRKSPLPKLTSLRLPWDCNPQTEVLLRKLQMFGFSSQALSNFIKVTSSVALIFLGFFFLNWCSRALRIEAC